MASYHESKILELIGDANGANRTFGTPTKFVAGSLRVIWNGLFCVPTDDRKGWSELTDQYIETSIPPLPGDVLQAYYLDKGDTEAGLEDVLGSPFDPNGMLP